jgi:hypothetical protein
VSLSVTASPADAGPAARIVCARCSSAYLPRLVHFACPVCRTPAPGAPVPRPGLRDDDRLLLIVALATLANLILLGVLAAAVLS